MARVEKSLSQTLKTAALLRRNRLAVKAVTVRRGHARAIIYVGEREQPTELDGCKSIAGVDGYGSHQRFTMLFKDVQLVWERHANPGRTTGDTARTTLSTLLKRYHNRCGLELGKPAKDQWVTILPDLSWPGYFKIQYISRCGLGGHLSGYVTPAEALLAALTQGFTQETPGVLQRLSTSEVWQQRYRIPESRQTENLTPPFSGEYLSLDVGALAQGGYYMTSCPNHPLSRNPLVFTSIGLGWAKLKALLVFTVEALPAHLLSRTAYFRLLKSICHPGGTSAYRSEQPQYSALPPRPQWRGFTRKVW